MLYLLAGKTHCLSIEISFLLAFIRFSPFSVVDLVNAIEINQEIGQPGYALKEEEEDENIQMRTDIQPFRRRKRRLAYPTYEIKIKYGYTWVYYVDSYFWYNQYATYSFNLGSIAANEEACMKLCIADNPSASGYTCMSLDWWPQQITNGCHLSEATSCNPTAGTYSHAANSQIKTQPDNSNLANLYEKYCACTLSEVPGIPITFTKDYDTTKVDEVEYTQNQVFANTQVSLCPVLSCDLKKSDCSTPLDADMQQYIKLSSDYSMTITQTAPLGYQSNQVCMTCRNEIQVLSRQFTITQRMNCLIALQSQSFLPSPHVYNYQAIPAIKTLPQTDATQIFTNSNLGDCGAMTNCYLRAQGCVDLYITGNVVMDPTTFAISAYQSIDPGFEEYLCVVCENAAGGTTGTLGDSWYFKQKMNCATALQAISQPLASQTHAYVDSASKVTSSNNWHDFFINNDPKGDCPNDSTVTCVLLNLGCNDPYTGSLTINSATGQIESPQNLDAGYNDTVCIQCNNGVGGSVINKDNWNVEQTSNCALATVKLIPDSAVEYNFLYRDFDYKSSPFQIPYKKVNIDYLKSRWEIEKVHCLDQIQSFEFYASDNTTLLRNNINETISIPQSEISVTTTYFNLQIKIYLRNFQQYGLVSRTQTLELSFFVTGCDLVGIYFNKEPPIENPRRDQYRFYNQEYPYLYQYSQNISSDSNDYIVHNMTETFVSEDQINCPCVEYKIEQVKDPVFDLVLGQGGGNGFDFSINSTGFFKITNYTSYHKFSIWLSCTNYAGVSSGMRIDNNIWLEYVKTFEVPNLPPSFKGGGVERVRFTQKGEDSKVGISGLGAIIYETTYNNRTNYTQPNYYPDRRYRVYTFPSTQDPEEESVELKLISTLNEITTTVRLDGDGKTQLIFDKQNIPFDKVLNKSSDGKETFKETIWLSLRDSYWNQAYFFLTVIFIPPVEISNGISNFTGNFTKTIDCSDKILTANITSIDRESFVNITFSNQLYNEMFRTTRVNEMLEKVPRWLEEEGKSGKDLNLSRSQQECYIWRKVPPYSMNLTDLNETQLQMYINPYNDRQLQDGFNISKLNFTWQIVYFRWEYVLVQLKFEAPNYISTEEVWDQFFFRVKGQYSNLFYSNEIDAEIHRDYWSLTHPIRPQIDQDSYYSRWIIWFAQFIKILLKVVFWGCVIANVFWGGSMRWYFTLIRTLQIVLHLPMVRLVVPTCVIYAYSIIIPIVKWDIFEGTPINPKDWLKNDKELVQSNGIYQQIQLLGYTTNSTLENLGSITIFFIVYIFKLVFLGLLKAVRVQYGKISFWQKTYNNLKRSLFFYELALIMIEPYIVYLIAGYMQFGYEFQKSEDPETIKTTSFYSSKIIERSGIVEGNRRFLQPNIQDQKTQDLSIETTNESISIFLLIVCLGILPMIFLYFLVHNIDMYQWHKFSVRHGNLFEDIDLRSKWQAAFYLVFIVRRIIFVSIFFSVERFSAIQLLFINLTNLAMLIYVGYNNSLIGKFSNRLEVFNELSVCFISFHMYFFTDWVLDKDNQTDKDLQYNYGIMMNCFITYYIYVNLWVICYFTLKWYSQVFFKYFRILRTLCWSQSKNAEMFMTKSEQNNDEVKKIMDKQRKYRDKKFYKPEFQYMASFELNNLRQKVKEIKTELTVIIEQPENKDLYANTLQLKRISNNDNFAAFMDNLQQENIQTNNQNQGKNFAAFLNGMAEDEATQQQSDDEKEYGGVDKVMVESYGSNANQQTKTTILALNNNQQNEFNLSQIISKTQFQNQQALQKFKDSNNMFKVENGNQDYFIKLSSGAEKKNKQRMKKKAQKLSKGFFQVQVEQNHELLKNKDFTFGDFMDDLTKNEDVEQDLSVSLTNSTVNSKAFLQPQDGGQEVGVSENDLEAELKK